MSESDGSGEQQGGAGLVHHRLGNRLGPGGIEARGLTAELSCDYGGYMTTRGIVTMVLVLLFVWGGFALFVATAVRKERHKRGGDA